MVTTLKTAAPATRPCPCCLGAGYVHDDGDAACGIPAHDCDCPRCGGAGVLPVEPAIVVAAPSAAPMSDADIDF